jgi:HlyD family secretion protein
MQFRKSAVDKLASPERLDILMQVTSPQGWLALTAIGVVLVGVVLWSIFGSLQERIPGSGVLVRGTGNSVIRAGGSGTLALNVSRDDVVIPGEVIARISGSGIDNTEETACNDYSAYQNQVRRDGLTDSQRINDFDQAITSAEGLKTSAQGELTLARDDLARLEARPDLVTGPQLAAARGRVNGLEQQIAGYDDAIRRNRSNITTTRALTGQRSAELTRLELRCEQAKTGTGEARDVTSTFSGRIVEIIPKDGDQVTTGDPIAIIENAGAELQVFAYVAVDQGDRLFQRLQELGEGGLEVQLDLGNAVRREEFGLLMGRLAEVGEIAVTDQAVMNRIQNAGIVSTILGDTPKTEIRIVLTPDPDTDSGFAWSSGRGPSLQLRGGSLVSAQIIADSRRPISLVVPILKGPFGGS